MRSENGDILLLDEEFSHNFVAKEREEVKSLMREFIECYADNKDNSVNEWLSKKIQEQLPDRNQEEIQSITNEIITTIKVDEEKKISLSNATRNGISKESWFATETLRATSAMSSHETVKYLKVLDDTLETANKSLYNTLTTKTGAINQNPRLDGFIAEQYHAQTFNLNAEARGSHYRAKVLEPNGKGYAKNSVDIVIVDDGGKIVKRYQSKYCKDAKATEKAFEHGDYRGQQKLVAEGQQADIHKKATIVIEAPDGTTSNPLSKSSAEKMRDEAQSGNWNELNWNEYKTKDIAIGIGKKASYSALQGAAIGVGVDIAQKVWNGEEIEGEEIVETAFTSGADFGVKAAAAGAIKVGVEKEIINVIPKGTSASTIANIVFVGVEDAKVVGKVMDGELSVKEGIEKVEQTTVSTAAGLVAMSKGAEIGAAAGTLFGPVGAAVGGFVGGSIACMAGSKVGEKIVKGVQKVRNAAVEVVKTIGSGIKNALSSVGSGFISVCASIFGF